MLFSPKPEIYSTIIAKAAQYERDRVIGVNLSHITIACLTIAYLTIACFTIANNSMPYIANNGMPNYTNQP